MNFSGKTAVVTGGSRGIGRAICLKLAAGGAHVVLCYAGNEDVARETAAECEKLGAKALAVRCNVADSAQVQALMDTAVKTFGGIHILINNAGITRDQLMMMMKEDAQLFPNLRFAGGWAMRSSGYSSAYVSGDLSGRQTVGDLKREVR